MRSIITTAIVFLVACGPTVERHDEHDITKPTRSPVEHVHEDGSSTTGLEDSSSSGEIGTGGGSGGSDGGESSSGAAPAGCMLPEADSACWAVIEAAETIGCESVGGSCWAVVAAQYFLGDADLAQSTATCEADCAEIEDACSFVPAGVPDVSVCYMATETDCLANAAADGIVLDESVVLTCASLAAAY